MKPHNIQDSTFLALATFVRGGDGAVHLPCYELRFRHVVIAPLRFFLISVGFNILNLKILSDCMYRGLVDI